MWSTLHSYGFYLLHANQPFHPLPHGTPLIGSTFFLQVIFLCFSFLPHSSSPFTNLLVLCPKTAPCPEAAAQATTAAASSRPLQSLSKTSLGWVLTGCNFNEAVRTRCERGPNEVQNQILGDWPRKSPDKLFGSYTLSHSCQNSKFKAFSGGAEEQTKPSSSYRQEQGDRRGDKGRVRETEGRQRDTSLANKAAVTNLSGHRRFET